ncbi:MAG: hypothetical protein AUG51_17020 [Acidobacteria bacterium 13_1_20CM_3_53_8]|nr:MAG: hypothetical protein AUG51_17020 [Acidobacteria bacterium 13_1_20CM_3_53_8]
MRRRQIVGWKTYGVAGLALASGLYALYHQAWADGIKGIIAGLALVALRDAIGKILQALNENRAALNNVRAAVEVLLSRFNERN